MRKLDNYRSIISADPRQLRSLRRSDRSLQRDASLRLDSAWNGARKIAKIENPPT
jgi:hypothetical protein